MQIYNLNSSIAFCEAKGLSKVFEAYADNCSNEDIMEIGFNPKSRYVYIALENGILIASFIGQHVEYISTNFENGEETFFKSYEEAMNSRKEK